MTTIIKYDLESRTLLFGIAVIHFCRSIVVTDINRSAITQLIRSATAVGANYQEANASMSKKDFQHKIAICRKEAKEAHFWLLTLHAFIDVESIKLNELTQESKELILIFSRIFVTSRGQKK